MRITERRLKSIIRSVIQESMNDGMVMLTNRELADIFNFFENRRKSECDVSQMNVAVHNIKNMICKIFANCQNNADGVIVPRSAVASIRFIGGGPEAVVYICYSPIRSGDAGLQSQEEIDDFEHAERERGVYSRNI